MHPYIVVSLLTGARTEEMRALRWDHVVLAPVAGVPPHMMVWRSVRRRGETKTRRSRRTIALPRLCVKALELQRVRQVAEREAAGAAWSETGLVFTTTRGGPLDVNNVRRDFRAALRLVDGLDADEWTPRELRHSFVSLLSDAGVPIEEISRLVGHSGTTVTELVYRHQIRPVVQGGAEVMDTLFDREPDGQ
jgi:integrase